jgi:ketosteroid isomerase-like protein
MRNLACGVLVLAFGTAVFGQMAEKKAEAKSSSAEQVEQALMDKILADDWVGLGPAGSLTKAQLLAGLKSGDLKLESETLGEMKVRVFGDTAVVTGSDDEKSSYKGKDSSGHHVWTDVFVKRQGHWQAVASQDTRMSEQ